MVETLYPRRSVMFSLAVASLASACTSSSATSADSGVAEAGKSDASSGEAGPTDAMLLNGLLADEYSAIDAYAAAAPYLGNPDPADPGVSLAPVVLQLAVAFALHHQDHAGALATAIRALGVAPIGDGEVSFALPTGFTATVANIMKLAANAERNAAVLYNQTIARLSAATNRFLAAAISGDEAQHFVVLDSLILGLASPGPNLSTSTATDVVPVSFADAVGVAQSLEDVADFSVTS